MPTIKTTTFRNRIVFGIVEDSNGRWVAYCYPTQKQAERVLRLSGAQRDGVSMNKLNALSAQCVYPHPVAFVDIGG